MNSWLSGQVQQVVTATRAMHANGTRHVFLHFRRGRVLASSLPFVEGYQRVTTLSAPLGKSEPELTEWVNHQVRRVPCCP